MAIETGDRLAFDLDEDGERIPRHLQGSRFGAPQPS